MRALLLSMALVCAAPPALAGEENASIAPISVGQGRTLAFTRNGQTVREPVYTLGIRYQGNDEPLVIDRLGPDDKVTADADTATNFSSEGQIKYDEKERTLTIDSEVGAGDWVTQSYTLVSTPAAKGMAHRLRLESYSYGEWDGETGGTKNEHFWVRRAVAGEKPDDVITFKDGSVYHVYALTQTSMGTSLTFPSYVERNDHKNGQVLQCLDLPFLDTQTDLVTCSQKTPPSGFQVDHYRNSRAGLVLDHSESVKPDEDSDA